MSRRSQLRGQRGGIIGSFISILFLALLIAGIYTFRHPLMRWAAEEWVVNEPPAHADVLVVLSDDDYFADRAENAAELYRQGVAPVVVASGRKLRPYAGIAELMERDLTERGVPKQNVVRFAHEAENTKEELEALAKLVQEHGWKRVVIVTSNYHARRARYLGERIFPGGVRLNVAGGKDTYFDAERWWEKRVSVKIFLRELMGSVMAWWEMRGHGKTSGKEELTGWLPSLAGPSV